MPDKKIYKVDITEFVSSENRQTASRARFGGARRNGGGARLTGGHKHKPNNARSLLIKVGVCASACALVLLLKWIDTPKINSALDSVKNATVEDHEFDEMLGKLRFVELPGILSVFAPNDKFQSPIAFSSATIENDDTVLALRAAMKQSAVAASNAMVKAVGMDELLGQYVSLVTAEDVELCYYGLTSVSVEEGQLLCRTDDVGGILDGSLLYITVRKAGQPVNPLDFYDIVIDVDN